MKRLFAGVLALALVGGILAAPAPALAHHGGRFVGGFAVGTVTGLVLGGILAPRVYYAPPPVVYQPAPVYVAPAPVYVAPAPVYMAPPVYCTDYWTGSYWQRVCR